MALGTFHAKAEENIAGGLHAIDHVFHTVFFLNQSTLIRRAVVSVETGCDFLIHVSFRKKIAGELFNREIPERYVFVVGINHPVTPRPHGAGSVGMVHAAVAVARHIHPVQRHPLGICF